MVLNLVDHMLTDQISVLRFVEDNFLGAKRIGQGSLDALAGLLNNMFDYDESRKDDGSPQLNPANGQPVDH